MCDMCSQEIRAGTDRDLGIAEDAGHVEAEAICEAVYTVPRAEAGTHGIVQDEGTRSSILMPILKVVVQASSAFTSLQSAASGLLKVIEIVEVRHCVSPASQYRTYHRLI